MGHEQRPLDPQDRPVTSILRKRENPTSHSAQLVDPQTAPPDNGLDTVRQCVDAQGLADLFTPDPKHPNRIHHAHDS
jgi:hypothetical protein